MTVCDVGPRDGLQNEPDVLAPTVRAELVDRLAGCGLPVVEVASFVDPRQVPQMAGAEEVVAALQPSENVVFAGLALNERGYERLAATGLGEVRYAFGATESFNLRNQNASVEESLGGARRITDRARADGIRVALTLSVAFGCPFEGRVDEDRVLVLASELAAARPDVIVLADTIGVATPGHVRRLVARVAELGVPVGGHFHNTRNTGYANALAALEAGATVLDASIGGLGGCPSHRARRGTSRPRTSSTSSRARASRRDRPGRARRGVGVARGRAGTAARGAGLPCGRLSARRVSAR